MTVKHTGKLFRGGEKSTCACCSLYDGRGYYCSVARQRQQESRFHRSTPRGFEPGSLVQEANGYSTGPVRHGENGVRLQALHSAPPQQPTPSVVKLQGRPAASVKPGQKSCVRSSGIITLSA
jgi:hypothetical protein